MLKTMLLKDKRAKLATPLNIARYRKAVYSAMWVQVTLVICHLPQGVVEASTHQREMTLSIYLVKEFTFTLICLNSSLNPLLYCWKIREVRQAVKETLTKGKYSFDRVSLLCF